MDFISATSSPVFTQLSPLSLSPGLVSLNLKYRVKHRVFGSRESNKSRKIAPVRGCYGLPGVHGSFASSNHSKDGSKVVSSSTRESVIQFVSKPLVYALFCIAIGFAPVQSFQAPALAVPFLSDVIRKRKKETLIEKEVVLKSIDHEFSGYTRRLLETVSVLLKSVEKVRKGDGDVAEVGKALDAVKAEKEKLENEIMSGLYSDLSRFKKEREVLMDRADGIVEDRERVESVDVVESEYNKIWERIDEIDDAVLKRETTTLSFGVRELMSIERECVELVKSFNREMKKKSSER